MSRQCPNCETPLIGEYCRSCGQRRLERLTVRAFADEVVRRVFRFDKAFVHTFWQMLCSPGTLVANYLSGRRAGVVDPIQYFISSAFVQFMIGAITRAAVPLLERASALSWIERIGSVVAVKILIIFWMASIWRMMFRAVRYNLAEIYVFATYAFGTIGLLWALLPLVDLILPISLGASTLTVAIAATVIEVAYITYAVWRFAPLPLWLSFVRVSLVLTIGYGLLVGLVGIDRAVVLLLPPMPAT